MTLTIDNDAVARMVLGVSAASAATAGQQTDITAAAARAIDKVLQFSQHFTGSSATSLGTPANPSTVWDEWATMEAAIFLAVRHRREIINDIKSQRDDALEAALNTVSFSDLQASSVSGATLTLQYIRRYVLMRLVRRSPRIFCSGGIVDQALNMTLNDIWNRFHWHWREREVVFTITPTNEETTITAASIAATGGSFAMTVDGQTTAAIAYNATAATIQTALESLSNVSVGDVTGVSTIGADLGINDAVVTLQWSGSFASKNVSVTADQSLIVGSNMVVAVSQTAGGSVTTDLDSNQSIKSIASRDLSYRDSHAIKLKWTTREHMNEMRGSDSLMTDRPLFFRIEGFANDSNWLLSPAPDKTYHAVGSVLLSGPTLPSSLTSTKEFNLFPPEFRPLIPEFTVAYALKAQNAPGWERELEDATTRLSAFLIKTDDRGAQDDDLGVRDVYHDQQSVLTDQFGFDYPFFFGSGQVQ